MHSSGSQEIGAVVRPDGEVIDLSDGPPMDDDTANDYVRAGQIGAFEEVFNENPGLAGADLNVEADDETHSADAVNSFKDHRHTIDGGLLEDGEEGKGTSSGGAHIDYVITAPGVTPENAQPVEGEPSDHGGQRVDVTVRRW